MTTFTDFFRLATRSEQDPNGWDPYPFQERFAEAEELCHLVRAPTASGKTATAVLGWLWRWQSKKAGTPRRLVYCLPMRVLVEQSIAEVEHWIDNLKLKGEIDVQPLMGGVDTGEWYLHPEMPAILVGTQDMLLSRGLNRGYAASRFHWPIDFGLLNNDCLWVFDEPQLMASGVSTSAQMAGLRKSLATFGPCPSVWMSATLEPEWLDTIDFKEKFPAEPLELNDDDYDARRPLHMRMTAEKTLGALGVPSAKDSRAVAKAILNKHLEGTQTLVVLNTVDRAKEVYAAIGAQTKKSPSPAILLVHSRFRPAERAELNRLLQDKGDAAKDRIIVATQVVEAGVDISARTLITELAPWASVVQRVGRCNRTGSDGPGKVFWIDLEEKLSLPYVKLDLDLARTQLTKLDGRSVSPKYLDEFKRQEGIKLSFEHKHVIRRRDLLDLFDTTPDLSGNDIDIQRFVRGDDPDMNVQVFWRGVPDDGPSPDEPAPQHHELCSVPVGQGGSAGLRAFLSALSERKRGHAYIWDHLDEQWMRIDARQLRPGLIILLPTTVGGYSSLGWDPTSTQAVVPCPLNGKTPEEGTSSDTNSSIPVALTIAQHTQNVCDELSLLLNSIGDLGGDWVDQLKKAARWHDLGKAHDNFQKAVRRANPKCDADHHWAKSGSSGRLRYERKYFRHELASALAAWQQDFPFAVVYLIAAHHGRPRVAIRALPGEDPPKDVDAPFALGVHHGDSLPEIDLGGNQKCPALVLNLSPMRLGGERSWTANALKLLGELGPFKLAYLEALLRAADVRASQKEAKHAGTQA
jgi:CRISPR-associated endonuclease/helicase Cas3